MQDGGRGTARDRNEETCQMTTASAHLRSLRRSVLALVALLACALGTGASAEPRATTLPRWASETVVIGYADRASLDRAL